MFKSGFPKLPIKENYFNTATICFFVWNKKFHISEAGTVPSGLRSHWPVMAAFKPSEARTLTSSYVNEIQTPVTKARMGSCLDSFSRTCVESPVFPPAGAAASFSLSLCQEWASWLQRAVFDVFDVFFWLWLFKNEYIYLPDYCII